ncbi:MAG: YXWGXW repeat-containing protein [Terracidiphilus sp.]
MNRLPRFVLCMTLTLAAALCVAGAHLKLIPAVTSVSAAVAGAQDQAPPDQGPDPASVNMAPSGPSYTTEAAPPPDQAGAPGQAPDDSGYAEQPTETADAPPPPLPDYQQPPPPEDGYIWTPGYWAWGPSGYYWVPGAWVEPPYSAALWSPGYWGFYGGRYLFYPGHWGMHIGFYGGINYGFGYVGLGYEGGYWNSGHFFYNRAYNNVNVRVVHNVYNYNAGNRGAFNRGNNNYNNNARTSYRGGQGGVQAAPRPSEAAAWHEPTAPRMSSQVQHAQSYGAVRGQSAAENHGRPATPAISKPLPADRNVRPQNRSGGKSDQRH